LIVALSDFSLTHKKQLLKANFFLVYDSKLVEGQQKKDNKSDG